MRSGPCLCVLLPELGAPPPGDRATVFEAIRCAFRSIARRGPAVVFLDDLHWADATTCELLPSLAAAMEEEALLLVGAYRSDEIARGHPLRRVRAELRRAGRLDELALEPLDREDTAALAARALGGAPAATLARTLYDRTQGVPFFIEELCAALVRGRRVAATPGGLELVGGGELPLPDTLRDAVLARADALSPERQGRWRRRASPGCASSWPWSPSWPARRRSTTPCRQRHPRGGRAGIGAFRHSLTREAFYRDIPWGRRRVLHRRLAEVLAARGARPELLAEHWAAAHEPERARLACLAAARAFEAVHAYRDALELVPAGARAVAARRRAGPARAAGAARPLRGAERRAGDRCACVGGGRRGAARRARPRGRGELEQRLAVVYELQALPERALAARERAAEAFAGAGDDAGAAAEFLAAVSQLEAMGGLTPALEIVAAGGRTRRTGGRRDLVARGLGLEGSIRAKLGDLDAGVALARDGLSIALADNLTATATELYLRFAAVLENAADLGGAEQVYGEAYEFCVTNGRLPPGRSASCASPMSCGRPGAGTRPRSSSGASSPTRRARRACCRRARRTRDLQRGARPHQGHAQAARRGPLLRAAPPAPALRAQHPDRPRVARGAGGQPRGGRRPLPRDRASLRSRRRTCHYAPMALRSAVTFFGVHGDVGDARSCAAALADMAAATTNRETLAALAHALGELALLERGPDDAVVEFSRALDLLRELELPYQRAQTQLRAALAFAAAGSREVAVERLTDTYRSARKLGAQPLAALAARELEALGEPAEERLGRRAAEDSSAPGSAAASCRCCGSCPWGARTARSRASCTSANGPSTCTSGTSSPNSTAAPGPRRSSAAGEIGLVA